MRSAASACQVRQLMALPRGARTGRGPLLAAWWMLERSVMGRLRRLAMPRNVLV
jgi:hypothetical protein